jgi:hypothetical protein
MTDLKISNNNTKNLTELKAKFDFFAHESNDRWTDDHRSTYITSNNGDYCLLKSGDTSPERQAMLAFICANFDQINFEKTSEGWQAIISVPAELEETIKSLEIIATPVWVAEKKKKQAPLRAKIESAQSGKIGEVVDNATYYNVFYKNSDGTYTEKYYVENQLDSIELVSINYILDKLSV